MTERKGQLTIKGAPLTILGETIKVGQKAPNFSLRTGFGPDTAITLDHSKGKIRILSVAPSLDTGVCEKQAIRFNEEAAKLGNDVVILQISVDLPPAQTRFCNAHLHGKTNVKMLSDYADKSFGAAYGAIIKEWQVLARSIFVIDKDDVVKYVEYTPAVEQQVNFDAALEAIKNLK